MDTATVEIFYEDGSKGYALLTNIRESQGKSMWCADGTDPTTWKRVIFFAEKQEGPYYHALQWIERKKEGTQS